MNPQNMSLDEQLRAMEELWESLSREETRLESPTWHKDALRETAVGHAAGKEQPIPDYPGLFQVMVMRGRREPAHLLVCQQHQRERNPVAEVFYGDVIAKSEQNGIKTQQQ